MNTTEAGDAFRNALAVEDASISGNATSFLREAILHRERLTDPLIGDFENAIAGFQLPPSPDDWLLLYEDIEAEASALLASIQASASTAEPMLGETEVQAIVDLLDEILFLVELYATDLASMTNEEIAQLLADEYELLDLIDAAGAEYLGTFELRQRAQLVASVEQDGGSTGLQNLPRHAVITADGSRAAFGTWGNGVDPEVLLLDAGSSVPVAAFQLPGSVTGLDLDAAGRRIAVAHKDVHATAFGLTGSVRLLDTGEGDLRQRDPLAVGDAALFSTQHPSATIALLLVGTRVDPVALPGIQGLLHLDRLTLTALPALVGATGWADHAVPLPGDPALIGTSLGFQAAFRTPAGTVLGADSLDALIF